MVGLIRELGGTGIQLDPPPPGMRFVKTEQKKPRNLKKSVKKNVGARKK